MALDLSRPATPPPAKPGTAKPNTRQSAKAQSEKLAERTEGMNGLFQLAAGVCVITGNFADAGACAKHGPPISAEAAQLAENNRYVANAIDFACAVGPFAGLIAAILPFGLQILVNHRRLPAEPLAQFGVSSPQALDAQVRADALKQQMEWMREQQDAEREMARLLQEMQESQNGATPREYETTP